LQANHQKLVNIIAKRNTQKDSQSKDSENLADNMDAISQKSVKSILSENNKNITNSVVIDSLNSNGKTNTITD